MVATWYKNYYLGNKNMYKISHKQIMDFEKDLKKHLN